MVVSSFFSHLWNYSCEDSISLRCCICGNVAFWFASIINIFVDYVAYNAKTPLSSSKPNASRNASSSSSWKSSHYLIQLKLQPTIFLSTKELFDAIILAGFNMLIVAPFICCPLFECLWNSIHGTNRVFETDIWNWKQEILVVWPMNMIINEITFYGAHYIMHYLNSGCLSYQIIHKIHHRFTAPNAICAAYAHPIEFIFGNVLCICIGPIIMNSHPYTSYAWFTLALLSTCKGHCGYNILNAKTHDIHHEKAFHNNYGVLHFGDYIMNTTYRSQSESNGEEKKKLK